MYLYLYPCQVRAAVGDSGLCFCACGATFERELTPLRVDFAQVLWALFCFRPVLQVNKSALCFLSFRFHVA